MLSLFENFYKNKTVLITGHTGFKGSWMSIWLKELGANVIGVALDPFSDRDNFVLSEIGNKMVDIRSDIRDLEKLKEIFSKYQPQIVFHLAAQPLVRLSYSKPVETYEVNVLGTIHIMEVIKETPSVKSSVLITTDKCYDNKEQFWGYRETDALGGYDPYSSSKGAAEIAINSWRKSYKMKIASVRAGNVIGGGDWSLDRIVPDCIKSLEKNNTIEIRNPDAIRPWQHVLEPLHSYLLLGKKIWEKPEKFCEGWNIGPSLDSVADVETITKKIINCYGNGKFQDISDKNQLHEANILMLDITKAILKLDWKPAMNLDQTIDLTVDWYKRYSSENVYDLCIEQINKYIQYRNANNAD